MVRYTEKEMILLPVWKKVMEGKIAACKKLMDTATNYDQYIPASNERCILKYNLGGHVGFREWAADQA